MKEFDITGFVNFPNPNSFNIKQLNTGKTFIYLVAVDFESDELSKITIKTDGDYVGDDITPKIHFDTSKLSVDEVVKIMRNEGNLEINDNLQFVSSVLLGWSKFTYNINNDIQPWVCSFRELTEEGRKLYYSFKKLNYDKDIRILTFNKI